MKFQAGCQQRRAGCGSHQERLFAGYEKMQRQAGLGMTQAVCGTYRISLSAAETSESISSSKDYCTSLADAGVKEG